MAMMRKAQHQLPAGKTVTFGPGGLHDGVRAAPQTGECLISDQIMLGSGRGGDHFVRRLRLPKYSW